MPSTTITKRGHTVDRVLAELMSLRGVTSAAIVDRDGFVIYIRKDFEINSEALGAAVQIMFGAANRSASHVHQENSVIVISENQEGLMIIAPLGPEFTLALVADNNALLGALRFEVKETLPVLSRILNRRA